jgi:hypothetical protein
LGNRALKPSSVSLNAPWFNGVHRRAMADEQDWHLLQLIFFQAKKAKYSGHSTC